MCSNADKLSAVLAKWLEPYSSTLVGGKMVASLPAIANLESKIRSTGWVSPNWSLSKELEPMLGGMGATILRPVIHSMVKDLPDEMIPEAMHGIVRSALDNGRLDLLEGKVSFDRDDIGRLHHLLELNLPVSGDRYEVQE